MKKKHLTTQEDVNKLIASINSSFNEDTPNPYAEKIYYPTGGEAATIKKEYSFLDKVRAIGDENNILHQWTFHRDDFFLPGDHIIPWGKDEQKKEEERIRKTIPIDQQIAYINNLYESKGPEDYANKTKRYERHLEDLKILEETSKWLKVPGTLIGGITNPDVLLPGGMVVGTGGKALAKSILFGAGIGGALGATNEYTMTATLGDTTSRDYKSAILYGALLGGGINGVFSAMGWGYNSLARSALHRVTELEKAAKGEPYLYNPKDQTLERLDGTGTKVPFNSVKPFDTTFNVVKDADIKKGVTYDKLTNFMKWFSFSPISRLVGLDQYPAVQALALKLQAPAFNIYVKTPEGLVPWIKKMNASDVKRELQQKSNLAAHLIDDAYKEAQRSGYIGTQKDFEKEAANEFLRVVEQAKEDIAKTVHSSANEQLVKLKEVQDSITDDILEKEYNDLLAEYEKAYDEAVNDAELQLYQTELATRVNKFKNLKQKFLDKEAELKKALNKSILEDKIKYIEDQIKELETKTNLSVSDKNRLEMLRNKQKNPASYKPKGKIPSSKNTEKIKNKLETLRTTHKTNKEVHKEEKKDLAAKIKTRKKQIDYSSKASKYAHTLKYKDKTKEKLRYKKVLDHMSSNKNQYHLLKEDKKRNIIHNPDAMGIELSKRLDEIDDQLATLYFDKIDPKYRKAIDAYVAHNKYYAEVAKSLKETAKKAGKKVEPSYYSPHTYATRRWDLNKILKMSDERLAIILEKAYTLDPLNKLILDERKKLYGNDAVDDEIKLTIKSMIEALRESGYNKDMGSGLFEPHVTPFGQYLKKRNLTLNDRYLEDLIDNSFKGRLADYQYRTAGKLALETLFGTSNKQELEKLIDKAVTQYGNKMSPSERHKISQQLNDLMQHVLGIPIDRIDTNAWYNKAGHTLMKTNYLAFGGKFGENAVTDFGVGVITNGFINSIKAVTPSLKAVVGLYKDKNYGKKWASDMIQLGIVSDLHASKALIRFDSEYGEGLLFDEALDKASEKFSHITGLVGATTLIRLTAVAAGTVDVANIAKSLKVTGHISPRDEMKMARIGLSKEDLLWIAEQPIEIKNGVLVDFHFDKWSDQNKVVAFQRAITQKMEEAVLRADDTMLPKILTYRSPFFRLAFQFMRYAYMSYERVLMKGLAEKDARLVVGLMTSATIYGSIQYLREQALIATGLIDKEDAHFNFIKDDGSIDEEAATRFAIKIARAMPQLGLLPDAIGRARAMMGYDAIGADRPDAVAEALFGIGGSRATQVLDLTKELANGELNTIHAWNALKSLIPGQNIFGIDQVYNPVIKDLIKDNFGKKVELF